MDLAELIPFPHRTMTRVHSGKLFFLFTFAALLQSCGKPLPQTPCDCAKEGIAILAEIHQSENQNLIREKELAIKKLMPVCQKLIAEQGVCPYEILKPYLSILSEDAFWTFGENVHDLILPHENVEPLWDTSEFDDSIRHLPSWNVDSSRRQ
jgi:hypothetical protein